MHKEKGFTIIEIVVVIAIILALEAIVWVSVARYDNKGKNAAIKGNLSTLMTRGASYFETNNNYNDFCTSDLGGGPIGREINAPNVGGDFICNENSTEWCACSKEIASSDVEEGTVFCVDSTGAKKEVNTECEIECPATEPNAGSSCQ